MSRAKLPWPGRNMRPQLCRRPCRVATCFDFWAKLLPNMERPDDKQRRRNAVTISRRNVLSGALAAPALIASARLGSLAAAQTLKISHQFPGGTIDEGDFRDRLCRKFGAELEKRTNGAVTAQVYPNSSLMKTVAQFSAVRKGALDLSLY